LYIRYSIPYESWDILKARAFLGFPAAAAKHKVLVFVNIRTYKSSDWIINHIFRSSHYNRNGAVERNLFCAVIWFFVRGDLALTPVIEIAVFFTPHFHWDSSVWILKIILDIQVSEFSKFRSEIPPISVWKISPNFGHFTVRYICVHIGAHATYFRSENEWGNWIISPVFTCHFVRAININFLWNFVNLFRGHKKVVLGFKNIMFVKVFLANLFSTVFEIEFRF